MVSSTRVQEPVCRCIRLVHSDISTRLLWAKRAACVLIVRSL